MFRSRMTMNVGYPASIEFVVFAASGKECSEVNKGVTSSSSQPLAYCDQWVAVDQLLIGFGLKTLIIYMTKQLSLVLNKLKGKNNYSL